MSYNKNSEVLIEYDDINYNQNVTILFSALT